MRNAIRRRIAWITSMWLIAMIAGCLSVAFDLAFLWPIVLGMVFGIIGNGIGIAYILGQEDCRYCGG